MHKFVAIIEKHGSKFSFSKKIVKNLLSVKVAYVATENS